MQSEGTVATAGYKLTTLLLHADGASFVTLTIDDDLRGCIGALEAHQPLAEDA
ncbi:MAG: AMMECR1 domain-containing protein [Anaerolineales bacterium]|nr:AMMECR1 domain-containing protein [Anaerolineales bacterium]